MPQAVVDPQQLRQFATQLRQFNEDLRSRLAHVQAAFARLGETWRDQEHAQFAELFMETTKVLHRFLGASDKHIPYLIKKAEKVEEYLHLRG